MSINYDISKYKMVGKFNNIENFFEDFFAFNKNIPANPSTPWQPPTDVYETPNEVVVKMAISGAKPENFRISFSDNILTISGFRTDNSPHEKTCFYQVEIRYGYFERSINISIPLDTDNIQATYNEGFLQVILPKAKQQPVKSFSIKISFKQ